MEHNAKSLDGNGLPAYNVKCAYSSQATSTSPTIGRLGSMVPKLNDSVFQVINNAFQITPNGRISGAKSIVIVTGSRHHHSKPRILNCIVIQAPTGQIRLGTFNENNWVPRNMRASEIT